MSDDPQMSAQASSVYSVGVIPVAGLPEIVAGNDLGLLISEQCAVNDTPILSGDLLVVAQKVVSKAEGAVQRISVQEPTDEALRLAERVGNDPRLVQIILDQSSRVVRAVPGVLIVETRHGFICANAGIDRSNVEGDDLVTTLPDDADLSARTIRDAIVERGPSTHSTHSTHSTSSGQASSGQASSGQASSGQAGSGWRGDPRGRGVGVVVSDTFNRPWREGSINVAIGTAGFDPLCDLRGSADDFGREMTTSTVSLADEVASMAQLVMGERGRVPVAIVRGVEWEPGDYPIGRLLRPPERDLFR